MEEKQTVINFFAGPGCGKSKFASGLFSMMKFNNQSVELITEYAKDLTYEERNQTLKDQIYVFAKQYHKMFRIDKNIKYLIVDSPLLLSINYLDESLYSSEMVDNFKNLVFSSYKTYNNINFYLRRKLSYFPFGRKQTEQEAILEDVKIKKLLMDNNIKFIEVDGTYIGLNQVLKILLYDELKVTNLFEIKPIIYGD